MSACPQSQIKLICSHARNAKKERSRSESVRRRRPGSDAKRKRGRSVKKKRGGEKRPKKRNAGQKRSERGKRRPNACGNKKNEKKRYLIDLPSVHRFCLSPSIHRLPDHQSTIQSTR